MGNYGQFRTSHYRFDTLYTRLFTCMVYYTFCNPLPCKPVYLYVYFCTYCWYFLHMVISPVVLQAIKLTRGIIFAALSKTSSILNPQKILVTIEIASPKSCTPDNTSSYSFCSAILSYLDMHHLFSSHYYSSCTLADALAFNLKIFIKC